MHRKKNIYLFQAERYKSWSEWAKSTNSIPETLPNAKILLIVRDPIGNIIGNWVLSYLIFFWMIVRLVSDFVHSFLNCKNVKSHRPDINKFLLERDTKYNCKLGRFWYYLVFHSLRTKPKVVRRHFINAFHEQLIWTDTCIRYGVLCSNVLTTPASGISWPLTMKRRTSFCWMGIDSPKTLFLSSRRWRPSWSCRPSTPRSISRTMVGKGSPASSCPRRPAWAKTRPEIIQNWAQRLSSISGRSSDPA